MVKLAMNIPKVNIIAVGSAIGLALFWGWQPLISLFTGEFNENLNIKIEWEVIETCQPEKLLVLHVQPQNKGSVPIEIGGKRGGSILVTVKQVPALLPKDQWVNPKNLPTVAEIDILKEHPSGYLIDRNVTYDELETIALQPGIYWAGAVVTYPDGDYVDQSTVVKIGEESCTKSSKLK